MQTVNQQWGWLFLVISLLSSTSASSCEIQQHIEVSDVSTTIRFFKGQKKEVVTFVGYSGAGYRDQAAMMDRVRTVLDQYSPENTIINAGGTAAGIGSVYQEAQKRGFATSGIVSSLALQYPDSVFSACAELILVIPDQSWGGYLPEDKELSPVSDVMVEISDTMIGIGGGAIARDELQEGRCRDKKVSFYPAMKLKSSSDCLSDDCLIGEAEKAFPDGVVACPEKPY